MGSDGKVLFGQPGLHPTPGRSFQVGGQDKAEAYRQTEAYQMAMRKRSMWVEPLFGGGQRVAPSKAISLEAFAESEYRRRDGGSGAKPEATDQAAARYSLLFVAKTGLGKSILRLNPDFFNSLLHFVNKTWP